MLDRCATSADQIGTDLVTVGAAQFGGVENVGFIRKGFKEIEKLIKREAFIKSKKSTHLDDSSAIFSIQASISEERQRELRPIFSGLGKLPS